MHQIDVYHIVQCNPSNTSGIGRVIKVANLPYMYCVLFVIIILFGPLCPLVPPGEQPYTPWPVENIINDIRSDSLDRYPTLKACTCRLFHLLHVLGYQAITYTVCTKQRV